MCKDITKAIVLKIARTNVNIKKAFLRQKQIL